ncbi:MAG: hypothetical protein EOP84_27790, partial [Verrucomicrobiaceae bacterium]
MTGPAPLDEPFVAVTASDVELIGAARLVSKLWDDVLAISIVGSDDPVMADIHIAKYDASVSTATGAKYPSGDI